MSNINQKIWTLITRHLSGEASPAEGKELRQWLDTDPKNREFYENIAASWNATPGESVDAPFLFDYEGGLGKLRDKMDRGGRFPVQKRKPLKRPSNIPVLSLAAVVLGCLLAASVFMTLQVWEIPAEVVTYSTSDSEQRIITLPDGSVVRLNRNSRIEYSENSGKESRDVHLEGEAFFNVSENPERPFVIRADGAVVQVLGTSFNVKGGDRVMVAVEEGLVSFRHVGHEEKSGAHLSAGQFGMLSEDGREVVIENTDIENYMGWMNGYLRFSDMPFSEVIKQLERIYGVEHAIAEAPVREYRLTVYSERMQMEEVLETIALALDLKYKRQKDVIVWTES